MKTRQILGIGLLVAGFAYMASQSKKKNAQKGVTEFTVIEGGNKEYVFNKPR